MASLIVSSRLGRGPARHRSTWSRRCKKPASIVTATAPTCPRVVRHCQELATHRAIIAASRRRGLSSRALVLRRDVNRRCSWRRQCTSSKETTGRPSQYTISGLCLVGTNVTKGGAVEMGLKQHEAAMPRFLLLAGIVLLIADYSFAQDSPDPTPMQCQLIRLAVAQYGFAAARRIIHRESYWRGLHRPFAPP